MKLIATAKDLNISPAQLILSWALNRGTSIVVKSTNEENERKSDASEIKLNQSI